MRSFSSRVHRFPRGPKGQLPVWAISKASCTKETVSKDSLLAQFPTLFRRDLELSRSMSEILLRPDVTGEGGCFFLKLEHLRVLVQDTTDAGPQIFVFDDNPIAADFAARLSRELHAAPMAPLEQVVVESALIYANQNFVNRFALLDTLTRRLLKELVASSNEESSLRLIPVKSAISQFHTAVVAYQRALDREDLVSGLQFHKSSNMSLELERTLQILLADYRSRAEEVFGALEDLREEVESVESTITQVLSASRNKLMRLNLKISIAALACGVSSMGFSAFGMNLPIPFQLDQSSWSFAAAGAVILSGGAATFSVGRLLYLRSNKKFTEVMDDVSLFKRINSEDFVYTLFTKRVMEDSNAVLLLSSALGRSVTLDELSRVRASADANGDHELTVSEILAYIKQEERVRSHQ